MAEGVERESTAQGTREQGVNIPAALDTVRQNSLDAYRKRPSTTAAGREPRIVAVSKTKTVDMILEAYTNGQRHFGESYVQELVEKATHPALSDCTDIRWHLIGHLQSNKCNSLTSAPRLWAVETIHSERVAI